MTIDNNPLRQYFRRPAIYLTLPSKAKYYPPGVINATETGELPVYPMTAIDEITSKTPDALFNGVAMYELIKSCVPNIVDPWSINSIDLDAVLVAIKSATGGNDMEIESMCPKCSDASTFTVSLMAILSQLKSGDYDALLSVNDLKFKFRPLTYREMNQAGMAQFEIQRMFANLENITDETERTNHTQAGLKKVTELTMSILSEAIEFIQTPTIRVEEKPFILDFLKNCDKNVYVTIRDYNGSLKAQNEVKPLNVTCPNCGHAYEQPFTLNTTDFFG